MRRFPDGMDAITDGVTCMRGAVARAVVRLQQLFGHRDSGCSKELRIHMGAVEKVPAGSPSKRSFCGVLSIMEQAIDEDRDALLGSRSSGIASVSLEHALSALRDEFKLGRLLFRVFVSGQSRALRPTVKEQIYLIGREALVNALRHSEATSIEADIEYLPRRLRVVVRDNGCGIKPEMVWSGRNGCCGIARMRERAESIGAQLRIWSRPSAGTEVEVSIPTDFVAEVV
jgi:signal transduction histidine kinase